MKELLSLLLLAPSLVWAQGSVLVLPPFPNGGTSYVSPCFRGEWTETLIARVREV